MTTEAQSASSSRRAILATAVGGLAALVAQALGRPAAIRGADGDAVTAGRDTGASNTTRVTTSGGNGLMGITSDTGGTGVYGSGGQMGLFGTATENYSFGVRGYTNSAYGKGGSFTGNGPSGIGSEATAWYGNGAYGASTLGVFPIAPVKTGVYGYADHDASARGVLGQSTIGLGVHGYATSGVGVRAQAGSGTALQVLGKATFSRSGRLALAAGQSSIAKSGVPLTSASMVLAVLQTNRSGIYVRAVVPSPSTSSFRIYLNAAVPGTTNVAWFVLN
jgi:hypothetical protein